MSMRSLLKWVGILIGLFLLIQLVPYGRSHTNPPVAAQPKWDSQQTLDLAKRACYDCHSNETVWPWYSNVAPISWLVQRDVDEGRQRLNFSEWNVASSSGRFRRNETGDMQETIQRGSMPPWFYILIHPNAALSQAEKQLLINGLNGSLSTTNQP
jgi:hypothetical protein